MALFDWDGDGDNDFFDDFFEFMAVKEIIEEEEKNDEEFQRWLMEEDENELPDDIEYDTSFTERYRRPPETNSYMTDEERRKNNIGAVIICIIALAGLIYFFAMLFH